MSVLRDVVATLDAAEIDYALIGAAALAVHGVSRATADIDFLTVDATVLDSEFWNSPERCRYPSLLTHSAG